MKNSIYKYLNEPKTKIGWVHGILACICSVGLSYLIMMSISSYIKMDYAYKIIPSMIITPILMTILSLWFLFCTSYLELIKKIIFLVVLIYVLKVLINA